MSFQNKATGLIISLAATAGALTLPNTASAGEHVDLSTKGCSTLINGDTYVEGNLVKHNDDLGVCMNMGPANSARQVYRQPAPDFRPNYVPQQQSFKTTDPADCEAISSLGRRQYQYGDLLFRRPDGVCIALGRPESPMGGQFLDDRSLANGYLNRTLNGCSVTLQPDGEKFKPNSIVLHIPSNIDPNHDNCVISGNLRHGAVRDAEPIYEPERINGPERWSAERREMREQQRREREWERNHHDARRPDEFRRPGEHPRFER